MRPANLTLPGLDGLRAIAVLGVLLFHGNISGVVPGGFLGVDVFFTLSGFLITSLLLREFDRNDTISIPGFYLRRARRLLPALVTMLLACAVFAPVLAPETAARLREDIPAALLYLSNWWQIVSKQSYFETFGRPPLLQHLWSLAIEEQFYLLWPGLALVTLKAGGRRALKWLSGVLALGVTGWMAYLAVSLGVPADTDPNRLYLASDTHAMGLLAGTWLACAWNPWLLIGRSQKPASLWTWDLIGGLGLLGLVYAYQGINEGTPWLYLGGFLCVSVFTMMVMSAACDGRTVVSRILDSTPMRWMGTRSYGLYLWHWPVFVLLRPGDELPADPWMAWVIRIAVSMVATEACQRWVENPIRYGRWAVSGTARWLAAAGVGALMMGSAWSLYLGQEKMQSLHNGNVLADFSRRLNADGHGVEDLHQTEVGKETGADLGSTTLNPVSTLLQPKGSVQLTAIGDSVLQGAQYHLARTIDGVLVDAEVGRQVSGGLKRIRELKAEGMLADTVLVHLGTNGFLYERQVEEMFNALSDRSRVIVMNVHADRRWSEGNNKLLSKAAAGRRNVSLVDWHDLAREHPEYFVKDGIHLTSLGIRVYSEQVRLAAGFAPRSATVSGIRRDDKGGPVPMSSPAGTGASHLPDAPTQDSGDRLRPMPPVTPVENG